LFEGSELGLSCTTDFIFTVRVGISICNIQQEWQNQVKKQNVGKPYLPTSLMPTRALERCMACLIKCDLILLLWRNKDRQNARQTFDWLMFWACQQRSYWQQGERGSVARFRVRLYNNQPTS